MSGSMRETIKALTSTFSATTVPYPLPDELRETIESFLERYDDIDDHDSQRFHDDFHALYLSHVAGVPEKRSAFLSALRLLRPAITGEARLTAWWDSALRPVIDGIGHKKNEIEDAREFVQSILVYDAEVDKEGEHARLSSIFTKKILDAYLARTDVSSSPEHVVSPDNEFVAHELETVLVTFGRKMPKVLLLALDELFVQKQYRIQALTLLSAFVRLQPPHLYLVLETPLIQHLEKCLLVDNSSMIIELTLVVLIMFLPHICGTLTSDHHLPKLFLVYCRILCWDKLRSNEEKDEDMDDGDSEEEDQGHDESEQAWEQVQDSIDYPGSSPPTLMHYFTFLYGLFPLNFMSFVRKPRKYLKSLNFPGARDFDLDQDLIHSRTEPYRRMHLLHPSIFITTREDELSENKWLKSDPADVVTECMDLCVAVSSTLEDPGPPPSAALPPVPDMSAKFSLDDQGSTTVHDSDESRRNTLSNMHISNEAADVDEPYELPRNKSIKSMTSIRSMASPLLKGRDMMDSPTLPPIKDISKQDLTNALGTTSRRFVSQQPSLDSFAQTVGGQSSSASHDPQNQTMASLQREIMLLRNDLNFERYLKLQHLTHIGQLQRKHIKEATAEAETQNLINTNKTLKARLAKADDMYAQLKKETLKSRNTSKKWETELNSRVRTYKDTAKTLQHDEGNLRFELQNTQTDYEQLKKIVERAEADQLKAQQRMRALEYELQDYTDVRHELQNAQHKILKFEDERKELHTFMQERHNLRNDLEIANMRLHSREQDRERSIKAYERRIMELETRLHNTERNTGKAGQVPPSVQQMLDSALETSHAKLQQMKKTHYRLLEQYTELQMKYHELEGEQQAELGQLYTRERSGQNDYAQSRISRSSSTRQSSNNYNNPRYLPSLSTEISSNDEREYYPDWRSPDSLHSPASTASPARPTRSDLLSNPKTQRSQTAPSPYPGFGGGFAGPDLSAHDPSRSPGLNQTSSSAKSSFSVDTEGSSGKEKKDGDKIDVKSEARIYGRGGAQNIGKKVKDKEQKKGASSKTGGFRGLKGIM